LAVRAVFSWAARNLPAAEDRAFRLLGASPCRQLGSDAVAALLGADPVETGWLLDRLTQRHLVEVSEDGRFGMHDLLRAYAAEQAAALRGAGRVAATARLAGYLRQTAERAVAERAVAERAVAERAVAERAVVAFPGERPPVPAGVAAGGYGPAAGRRGRNAMQ